MARLHTFKHVDLRKAHLKSIKVALVDIGVKYYVHVSLATIKKNNKGEEQKIDQAVKIQSNEDKEKKEPKVAYTLDKYRATVWDWKISIKTFVDKVHTELVTMVRTRNASNQTTQIEHDRMIEKEKDIIAELTQQHEKIEKELSLDKEITHYMNIIHDVSLGNYISKQVEYCHAPWEYRNRFEIPANCVDKNQMKTFGGKMSVIFALEGPVTLGVCHCSHRVHDFLKYHQGLFTLLEVPETCMIVFSNNLYHYGTRTGFGNTILQRKVRAFAYMLPKCMKLSEIHVYTANYDGEGWCQTSCNVCKPVRSHLLDGRNRFDKGSSTWRTNMSMKTISELSPGKTVMGDLASLGWVVLKSFMWKVENKDKFHNWLHEMNQITLDLSSWVTIHVSPTPEPEIGRQKKTRSIQT